MNISKNIIISSALLMQAFSFAADAGNSTGLRLAASGAANQNLSITSKKPKCVQNVIGTKWKGTKFYQGGGSSNFTIQFNGGGWGTEVGGVAAPITWQQFGATVKWKKNIEDGKVEHKVGLKCNRMAGKFAIYDISGPLLSTGTVKLTLIN